MTESCTGRGGPPNKRDDILFMCFVPQTNQIARVPACCSQNQSKLLLVFACGFCFVGNLYFKDIQRLLYFVISVNPDTTGEEEGGWGRAECLQQRTILLDIHDCKILIDL